MKKILIGSIFTILINYCIGATYIIYKGSEKYVRVNRTNASSAD